MNVIEAKRGQTLTLGRMGENKRTQIVFDISDWLEEYPNGTIGLNNRIPDSGESYPIAYLETEDGKAIWTVTSSELTRHGYGKCQLTLSEDEVVAKDAWWDTLILESLDGGGTSPEPWEDWKDYFIGLKDDAEDAAEAAEDAMEAVQDMGVESTTLPEGSSATVTKTVDQQTGAVTITFGIPKGDTGEAGQDGADGYSPAASVSKSGKTVTVTITDKNGTTTETVQDGEDGEDGQDGAPGADGADGFSPVASVSKSGKTATISITDKNGTTSAQVSDGDPTTIVGDIAENATWNLFDGEITNFASSSGKVVSYPACRSYVWPVSNGDNFVTSRKSTSVCNRFRVFYTTEYPEVGVTTYKEDGTAGTPNQYAGDSDRTKTHTVPSSQTFKYAVLFLSNDSETIDDSCEIMINSGNREQMWEKYRLTAIDSKARTAAGKLEEAADGTVTGYDNLFTGNVVKLGWSNGVISSGANYRSFYWRVSKGETYTISRKNKTDFSLFRIAFTTEEPAPYVLVYTTAGAQESPGSNGDNYRSYSFTVPTNLNYKYAMLELSSTGQTINDACELMINRGEAEHPYQKYRFTAIDLEAREAEEEVTLRHMRYPWNKVSTPVPNLTLLHFSDIHGDAVNLASIAAFRAKYDSLIDDAICTGDMVLQKYGEGAYTLMDAMPDTLQVIGNHDTNNGSDWFDLDESDTYDKYFAAYAENWDAETTSGKCYYYKDYAAIGIRLIVLDNMHESAEQLSWFETALAGAKTAGYTVVCADHIAYTGLTSLQTDFDTEYMTHRFDTTRTHAYENRSEDYPDAVDDFIEGGGKFACWLTGHVHASMFAQLTNHPGQIMISAPNAGIKSPTETRESERISGTPTQNAFNIVAIDPTLSLVKVMRIGCRRTIWGKHPTMTVWDYANQRFTSGEPDGGIEVDDALDASSENPVQNKVIYAAIGDIETLLAAL